MTLYKSLVRSLLEFCCPLWNPWKITDIQLLEGVQRTVTSKIIEVKHLKYWDRLKVLGLMSLQRRRERYIILLMWKIKNEMCPNDVEIQFTPPSRLGVRAKVPPLSKNSMMRHQTTYDYSFSVMGPKLWNVIPSDLTLIDDFQNFKTRLTSFLKNIPDQPPIRGYTSPDNSLVDWYGKW